MAIWALMKVIRLVKRWQVQESERVVHPVGKARQVMQHPYTELALYIARTPFGDRVMLEQLLLQIPLRRCLQPPLAKVHSSSCSATQFQLPFEARLICGYSNLFYLLKTAPLLLLVSFVCT